jgi:hypothetical protein
MAKAIGAPKTGGRKKGVSNKRTIAKTEAIEQSGLTPLAYMLSVLRNEELEQAVRMDAAKSAAPYVHPKLANTELSTKNNEPLMLDVLFRNV